MTNISKLDLGRFVQVRERKNGSYRVLMVVPARLRPEGWPASIRLPETGLFDGDLSNPRFVEVVRANAKRLNQALDRQRELAAHNEGVEKNIPGLVSIYFQSPNYEDLSKSRQIRNKRNLERIVQWSASRKHPAVEALTSATINQHLNAYPLNSSTRYDMRATWSVVLSYAWKELGWITAHPLAGGKWYYPKPGKVRLWTREDVELHSARALYMKQPGLAALVEVMLEIGQRPGDMRNLTWSENVVGDTLVLEQSKTRGLVSAPLSLPLREMIRSVKLEGSDYIFNDWDTRTGFTVANLDARFREVRNHLARKGEQRLQLRALRHSCVTTMFAAGCGVDQIAAVTGHKFNRVHQILERYHVDRAGAADKGLRKVWAERGLRPEDFGDVAPLPANHWAAGPVKELNLHKPLEVTERNFRRDMATLLGQHRKHLAIPREMMETCWIDDALSPAKTMADIE